MKYNHLLIIILIISSIASGMEIKRKSSFTKEALTKLIYPAKTIITISDQLNDHDVSIESTDQDIASDVGNKIKETNENSPKKNILIKQSSFERL